METYDVQNFVHFGITVLLHNLMTILSVQLKMGVVPWWDEIQQQNLLDIILTASY